MNDPEKIKSVTALRIRSVLSPSRRDPNIVVLIAVVAIISCRKSIIVGPRSDCRTDQSGL